MWRLFDFLLFITAIVALVIDMTISAYLEHMSLSAVRFLLLSFFLLVYWVGNLAAAKDRKTETANIHLPLWAKRILFLGHPNPFRQRTIICKIILIATFLPVLPMMLIVPDNSITYIIVLINLCIQLAYNIFSDITL